VIKIRDDGKNEANSCDKSHFRAVSGHIGLANRMKSAQQNGTDAPLQRSFINL